jgi:tRNA(Ile)-lysidine synthase
MTATGAASAAPPDALVARFKTALDRLWPDGGKLGLAVSGGPDSLAMLLLAEAAIPGQFEVATVDHGLRPEAAEECAMVARICAERGIVCEVLQATVAPGNTQAMARLARYGVLASWAERRSLSAVATAHHADDQAETLLMRLNRGSGVAGLAGVREIGELPASIIPVVRPVLEFRRVELASLAASACLQPAQDPSNADDRYDRVRIRKAIAASEWLDVRGLAAAAANLADADAALDDAARQLWNERISLSEAEDEYRYRPPAPRAIEIRLVDWIISGLGLRPRGQDVARLIDRLRRGEGGNLAGVLATVEGEEWVFRREPPRRTG